MTQTEKGDPYYSVARKEILSLLPQQSARVLDIGCGFGHTSAMLKKMNKAQWVCGLETFPEAAKEAQNLLDKVLQLDLNQSTSLPLEEKSFDLILALDVLEHLVDPWAALKMITKYLSPNGSIIISLPNIRHYSVLFPLFFSGRFEYQKSGILDSTHLRFFTRSSILQFAESSGLTVDGTQHVGRPVGKKTWFLNLLTLGIFREFLDTQYIVRLKA